MTNLKPPGQSRANPEEAFFLSLNGVYTVVQKFTEETLRDVGVTTSEYAMLRLIDGHPGITAGETRARLYATAPSVAQLVAQLERRELIKRTKDPIDARRQPLRLTPKGVNVVKRSKRAIAQLIEKMALPAGLIDSLTINLSTLLSSLPPYGTK